MTADGASASGEASYSGFGAHASASFYASHNDSKVSSDVGMAGESRTFFGAAVMGTAPAMLQACRVAATRRPVWGCRSTVLSLCSFGPTVILLGVKGLFSVQAHL